MNYIINVSGLRPAVKKLVLANGQAPFPLKQMIADICDQTPKENQPNGISVAAQGEENGGLATVTLEIKLVAIATPKAAAPAKVENKGDPTA